MDEIGRFDRKYFGGVYEAPDGLISQTITIARNETPGRWKVVATDIVSQKKTERTFMIIGNAGSVFR